jgi:hypothetical protein
MTVAPKKSHERYGKKNHWRNSSALLLEAILKDDDGLNTQTLDEVCALNGMDISHYDRTTHGWQGRLRMITYTLLNTHVKRTGELKLPGGRKATFVNDVSCILSWEDAW